MNIEIISIFWKTFFFVKNHPKYEKLKPNKFYLVHLIILFIYFLANTEKINTKILKYGQNIKNFSISVQCKYIKPVKILYIEF